jgi:sarcosine oxidase subunit beta
VQDGYLFLLDRLEDVERFRAAVELQNGFGVPSREIGVAEAVAIVPELDPEGLLAATFSPTDGRATPEAVVAGYAAAARRGGAEIRQGEPVERIEVREGRIEAVVTAKGRIATDTVVCAAGVWSREVAELAGLDLPVRGERRHMWYTPERGPLPATLPLTCDFSTGFYCHAEGPGIAFGGREPSLESVAEHAARRLPALAELPIQSTWSGFYEMSPDHNAIVGEAAEPERFLYATGFSGHGFQQAPAVGEHLAELVAGREPTLDLSAFRLERFVEGAQREEAFVI